MEEAILHTNMEFNMYIEWPQGILYLGIITKEFLAECCILLVKSMYGNFDAALLWLILLARYLVNECSLGKIKKWSWNS